MDDSPATENNAILPLIVRRELAVGRHHAHHEDCTTWSRGAPAVDPSIVTTPAGSSWVHELLNDETGKVERSRPGGEDWWTNDFRPELQEMVQSVRAV